MVLKGTKNFALEKEILEALNRKFPDLYKYAETSKVVAKSGDTMNGPLSFFGPFSQIHFRSSTPVATHDVGTSIISDKDAWIGFARNTYLDETYTWQRDSVTEPSALLGIDSDGAFNFYTYAAGVDPTGVSGVMKIDTTGTLFISPAATTTNPDPNIHTIQRTGATNAMLGISQTGTGNAQLLLDASNGDFIGGDYAQIKHNTADLTLEIFNGDAALTNIKLDQAGQITMTGGLIINATDTTNIIGLAVNQLDTGTSIAATIVNIGTGNGLFIDQNGNGVALHIDNDGTANSITVEGTSATDLIVTKAGLVGIGQTPTGTSRLEILLTGVPVAANNAAAATAGVVIGGFYRTNADPSVLCIRSA